MLPSDIKKKLESARSYSDNIDDEVAQSAFNELYDVLKIVIEILERHENKLNQSLKS